MVNTLTVRFNTTNNDVDILEGNIIILENPIKDTTYNYPFSPDCVCTIIIKTGKLTCEIDMEQLDIDRTGLLIILSFQVVENLSFSDDFQGTIILFSQTFLDSLAISDAFTRLVNVRSSPFSAVEGESFDSLKNYAVMLKNTIRQKRHPYREEVARLLTKAFCLGLGYYIHSDIPLKHISRADEISRSFIDLVRKHCMTERELAFYADKLCISIKHLSAMIYKTTNKAPSKWIEDYTILKAKLLLATSSESILAISENMAFKSQSDFGKYFKRQTGLTPMEFRCRRLGN